MEKGSRKGNHSLALIIYQKDQLPVAFRGWQEGCGSSKQADLMIKDVGLSAKKGRRDAHGNGRQEVIDLVSDDEEDQGFTDAPLESLEKDGGSSQGKAMDNGSSGDAAAAQAKTSRRQLFRDERFSNCARPGEDPEHQGNYSNGGSMRACVKSMPEIKKNGESAGVIPLADDDDLVDWTMIGRKGDLAEGTCTMAAGERSIKRKVAVKTTQSSAKRSNLNSAVMQLEAMKQQSFLEDLASVEFRGKKPRMRGELKIPAAPTLVSNNGMASASETLEEEPLQALEEVPTLLRVDGSSEGQEESEERKLLRQTLQRFEVLRRKVLREEEIRVKETRNAVKRPDLKAGSIMKSNNEWLNKSKRIGEIPGVEVGDQFYFRIELCIVGLHRQIQGGIDSIHSKESQWEVPLAVSIIASGGYEDDLDTWETLIYTGQGGNNYQGNKRQKQDQKLERGNLALKHSYKIGIPVRVIRGIKFKDSPSGKIYTYDGLYKVEKFWLDRGLSGFGVYKFQLQRLPGQLRTSSAIVKFMGTMKTRLVEKQPMMIHEDISRGKERHKICVVNSADELTELPAKFEYITSMLLPLEFEKSPLPERCTCVDGCSDPAVCSCIRRNGGELPYTGDGALIRIKNMVYECGQHCQCSPDCYNRVSQHGINYRLELFKKEKGWGVRSWDSISAGSYVCEYIGKVVASNKVQKSLEQCNYVLDVDQVKQGTVARDVSMSRREPARNNVAEESEGKSFSIDAREYGNIARFINDSSSPNLWVQLVIYDHEDSKLPHVALFALENIHPFTELTFDHDQGVADFSDSETISD